MRVPVADKPWLAAWLIARRSDKGWTQAEAITNLVAANIGVKPGSYPAWEVGNRKPSAGLLAKIAGLYGVPIPTEPTPGDPPLSDMDRLIASNLALAEQVKRVMDYLTGVTVGSEPTPGGGTPDPLAALAIVQAAGQAAHRAVAALGREENQPPGDTPA